MRSFNNVIGVILNFLLLFPLISSELFTAIVHLEKLIDAEKQVINLLDHYLLAQEERISRLKNYKLYYNQLHSITSKNIQHFLSNPINTYILIKRLTTDLDKISQSSCVDKNYFIDPENNDNFPTYEDLTGSMRAILRLQDTYKLETKSLADGYILIFKTLKSNFDNSDNESRLIMTSNDCFELGRYAYSNNDFIHTEMWMKEAMERMKAENLNNVALEVTILDYLSHASYMNGNISQALEFTQQILYLMPDNQKALGNAQIYTEMLKQYELDQTKNEKAFNSPEESDISSSVPETEKEIYESLCRGENRLSDKIKSKLFCFYLNTDKIPYLRYTRIKVEEAFKRPQIVVFHDFISDNEMEVIKSLAAPNLNRAGVQDYKLGATIMDGIRSSKTTWLHNIDHPVVNKIQKRIGDFTGLEMSTAEPIQIAHYGVGGHYNAHLDFDPPNQRTIISLAGYGNRIATWLSYMNDVEAGGATVFPKLGITLWPVKSSAAFWYNLRKNGDGDFLTRHAACPVLIGTKWAFNEWFHEKGQEFRKPCSLNKEDLNIVQEI